MNTLYSNLVACDLSEEGKPKQMLSVIDGQSLGYVPHLDTDEIGSVINRMQRRFVKPEEKCVIEFLKRLAANMEGAKQELIRVHQEESGFNSIDNEEIIDAVIEYLHDFELSVNRINAIDEQSDRHMPHSFREEMGRTMKLIKRPYQCVAVMVPQNASLSLAVICIASAIYVGARVIVRPSTQCGASAGLLAKLINLSEPPAGSISIVNSSAKAFLEACYQSTSVELIHYIGSDNHAMRVLTEGYTNGKLSLVDGEGNTMVYVDKSISVSLEEMAETLAKGITRYNGATCTSINGVLVHPDLYEELKAKLSAVLSGMTMGCPKEGINQIGPLYSEQQACAIMGRVLEGAKAQIVCGGEREAAYLSPTLIEGVGSKDKAVTHGFFGPAAWIAPADKETIWTWLDSNRYPLCDAVFSNDNVLIHQFINRSRAGRICINQDPSVESMFEPWGAYPPAGLNSVSFWTTKYMKTIQLDGSDDWMASDAQAIGY